MTMRKVIWIFLALLPGVQAFSQISNGGTPASFELSLKSTNDIPMFVLPEVDRDRLLMEDMDSEVTGCNYRVAKAFQVDLNPDNSGKWDDLADGGRIWRLRIKAPGASGLNVYFNRYTLPEEASLFIYSPDRSKILGGYTSANNKEFGKLNVQPLAGEELVVEYNEPAGYEGKALLQIGNIGHFYRGNALFSTAGYGDSESCNKNVICADGDNWRDQIRSVAKILFQDNSGNYFLCSGALINNAKNDGTAYLLTANHCLPFYIQAESAIFYFNYESPVCSPQQDGDDTQTISGSSIIVTSNLLDFCLVKLSKPPPESYNVYYSGWDATPDAPEQGVCIHHPIGDIKKITLYTKAPVTGDFVYEWDFDDNTHWYIAKWAKGITQGGSSGSPLYNQDKRIVGDLTGGSTIANCTSADAYFAKFSESWDKYSEPKYQLKAWLDPDNKGVTYLDGIDASEAIGIRDSPDNLISVYPNPVENMLYLHSPAGYSPTQIHLYDLSGRIIKGLTGTGNTNTIMADVSSLQPGLYLLRIMINDQSVTKKIVIRSF